MKILDNKQKSVLRGMLTGAAFALAIIVLASWLNPFSFQPDLSEYARLSVAIKASVVPAIFLAIAIGRLARHRFFTPEDIDGGGLRQMTDRAKLLQSLLQNTLEQFALAIVAYCAWAVVMPAVWLSVIPLAATAFAVGRVMFFVGYRHGAPSRAIGFTLAFYTSLMMLAAVVLAIFVQAFFR